MNWEKKFFLTLLILNVTLIVYGIISMIVFSISLYHSGEAIFSIFEILYFALHMIIITVSLLIVINAFKKGSKVMRNIMYERYFDSRPSKAAFILSLSLMIFGALMFIYFTLAIFIPQIPVFHFPITLLYTISNSMLTLSIFALFFLLYPKLYESHKKEDKS